MINMQDFIMNAPYFKKITVDELHFAEFKCPHNEGKTNIWFHNNFFAHVLTGKTVLQTAQRKYILQPGNSAFVRKGSVITHDDVHENFCELLVFVPDDFIKTVLCKYNLSLEDAGSAETSDTIIILETDAVLQAYFQSLLTHFLSPVPPAEMLLKLKFEELLINLASGRQQPSLRRCLSEICRASKPSIKTIMEVNFFSNLSLEEYAKLCSRSLSAFKKEFGEIFHTTPGKWLQEKRLKHSRYLLETTGQSIDEICMDCGFENRSHFIRVFKNKFGVPPGKYKRSSNPA